MLDTSQFKGWTAAEARQRTGDSNLGGVASGHLVESGGLIYPVLHAPQRAALVTNSTLAETFQKFVLRDPELLALIKHANSVERPEDEYFGDDGGFAFERGHCLGPRNEPVWPVAFEQRNLGNVIHLDPEKRSPIGFLAEPSHPEDVAVADVLIDRFGALMAMLRAGEIEAEGHPIEAGHSKMILRTIWSSDAFYFDGTTGDVFEVNNSAEASDDWLTKRWVGLVLRRGQPSIGALKTSAQAPRPIQKRQEVGSPDIDGLSLGAAFMRCVIEDATVQELGCMVVEEERHHRFVFEEGRLPGRDMNYRWPVAPPDGPWLREQFGSGRIPDGFDYMASNSVRNASVFMTDRMRTLFNRLRSGEVTATGTYCATGIEGAVSKAQWSRSEASIDIRTSDLFESIDGQATRLWTNLRLEVVSKPIIIRGVERAAPFTPDEVAAVGSLERVLDRLVFNHPQVAALRDKAKAAMAAEKKPFYDNVGLISPVYGHDEEMMALKNTADIDHAMSHVEYANLLKDTAWEKSLPEWPTEYNDFTDEIELRVYTLFEMLRTGQLEGVCYTASSKQRETLLPTIWGREEYYILPRTGDVFEAKPMKMVPRWTGVVLQVPASAAAKPVPAIRNVVALPVVQRPNPKSTATPALGKKRGRKATVQERVLEAMRADLANGSMTVDALEQMLEKSMEEKYDASRDTCRKARTTVLAEQAGTKSRNGTRT